VPVGVGIDTRKNDSEDDSLPPFVVCCLLFSAAAAVTALTTLYGDLDQPAQLSHWNASGGDPCTQNWQGVICSGSNVTELYVISLPNLVFLLFLELGFGNSALSFRRIQSTSSQD
jgi:hypothetical protein